MGRCLSLCSTSACVLRSPGRRRASQVAEQDGHTLAHLHLDTRVSLGDILHPSHYLGHVCGRGAGRSDRSRGMRIGTAADRMAARSRTSSLRSVNDGNAAAGGVVGQVALRNWAGRCVWSRWQATASFAGHSVSFSCWSVRGASSPSKYRYSG